MTRRSRLILAAGAVVLTVGFACGGLRKGAMAPRASPPPASPAQEALAWEKAQGVFETRCVVCHGCYDAPCQLKLGTFDGIARGARSARVYDPSRLVAAAPTRLDVDAHDVAAWRKKGFHGVLPEGQTGDPRLSLLVQMLDLKRSHPVSLASDLGKDFTFELDRKETCATEEHFDDYAKKHPLWGMPYALPGLDTERERALVSWVNAGAPHPAPAPLRAPVNAAIAEWESFLDDPSAKGTLVGRYIYEHLFLASLYFKGLDDETFFRLVRSRTPSGSPVDEIPTRRPFDDPGVARVYYRFVRRLERPLEKTFMPYALDAERLRHWKVLFFAPSYSAEPLPSYAPEVSANPFRAFRAIPAESRYRFMLEEAEYTMMGFIKGPVCRGQVALDVIDDRFWVSFFRPDLPWMKEETDFLAGVAQDLDMPAEGGSTALPTLWLRYGGEHARYVAELKSFIEKETRSGAGVTPDLLWDGDGTNANAALTVFRHFDSATVVKGFVGRPTKTAWVVGYPLLERIHYLLVAGFDVFGNVTHQVTTRLYMDFLRMEGEAAFLMFLPPAQRKGLTDFWYRGVSGATERTAGDVLDGFTWAPKIPYRTGDPQRELYSLIGARVGKAASHQFDLDRIDSAATRDAVAALGKIRGRAASLFPEMSFVAVPEHEGEAAAYFTILRDSGHTNVAYLFREDQRRVTAEDELTVVPGFLGAYPNALFEVQAPDLRAFVDAASGLADEAGYAALRKRFGVSRASDGFWGYSDRINGDHRKKRGLAAGLFDYNRLEGL